MRRVRFFIASFLLVIFAATSFCFARPYELKNKTPEIQQALKNRHARYAELKKLKQAGLIGENNQGYVTSLKEDPLGTALVPAENADRAIIYQALVSQNTLGPNGLSHVQTAFAEVQRGKAGSGEMVQSPSGDWEQKA